jgi:hypothetical protein
LGAAGNFFEACVDAFEALDNLPEYPEHKDPERGDKRQKERVDRNHGRTSPASIYPQLSAPQQFSQPAEVDSTLNLE